MKLSMKIRAHEAELLVVGTEEEQTAEITRIMLQGCTAEVPSRLRAQLQNRAFLVRDQSAKDHFWVRDRGRQVRDRSPPHTPADGHHRCFWLRHRSKRAQCARRHQASTPVRRAACCVDAFLWLSSRAFCDPAGGRICVV
jgi:hypothetical protein